MKPIFDRDEAWRLITGASYVWDNCLEGTAVQNAPVIQRYLAEGHGSIPRRASLQLCRALAAEIRRYNRNPFGRGVGNGFGSNTL